jgi:BRCA1-associated protein
VRARLLVPVVEVDETTHRDALPNRVTALLKFRDADDAELFLDEFNGKPFWAMLDDEVCHIVRIKSVDVVATTTPPFTFPLDDGPPSTPTGSATHELPACPVCLERMDSAVTGLATIMCGHQFHCTCLSKWSGTRCPVCRYSQTRSTRPQEEPSTATTCDRCGAGAAGESLWMCLLCGHVGCGRCASPSSCCSLNWPR